MKGISTQRREDAKDFPSRVAWAVWLDENHSSSSGVWVRLAKKGSGVGSVSYAEALDVALCYGWIDGQKKPESSDFWLQRFCPRSRKSIWSQINCGKALALIESGLMKPAGLAEIERAKSDGRWGLLTLPLRMLLFRMIFSWLWMGMLGLLNSLLVWIV